MQFGLDDKLIEDIVAIACRYAVEKVIIFGSRAREDYRPASDIDLAFFPLPGFNEGGFLYADIDDLDTLLKIDLVLVSESTDPAFLENILGEGVLIYEQSARQTG